MDVFDLRDQLVHDYATYINSFINIQDETVRDYVHSSLRDGVLWPDPLIQLNPAFRPGASIDELVDDGTLHPECRKIFRRAKSPTSDGAPMRLHRHQEEAIRTAAVGHNYVLTTGTGSGKSLSYIVPIVDFALRSRPRRGIKAIVVYPMNALANSQWGELEKLLVFGYPRGEQPVTFERYTGQESEEDREKILANPPDILLTNYVMLELILTRPQERKLIQAAQGLRFLVLDELHTYRGRQGADVALLVRRTRDHLAADELQHVGTSATLAGAGTYDDQRREVADVATLLFGAPVEAEHVIGETLETITSPRDLSSADFQREITARLRDGGRQPPDRFEGIVADPLAAWIEHTFGVRREEPGGRLVRATPRSITGPDGAAKALAQLTSEPEARCVEAIQQTLLAGYDCRNPRTDFPTFAFRVHQFISRGDTVYASLDAEHERQLTLQAQTYVPGDRSRVCLPLAFCRECGQEYYSVRARREERDDPRTFLPRELSDRFSDAIEGTAGFLYLSTDAPWPTGEQEVLERVPEDWTEVHRGASRVRPARRPDLPLPVRVGHDGVERHDGVAMHWIEAPFRFCLRCEVEYGARQASDFAKLATLSSEGGAPPPRS